MGAEKGETHVLVPSSLHGHGRDGARRAPLKEHCVGQREPHRQ